MDTIRLHTYLFSWVNMPRKNLLRALLRALLGGLVGAGTIIIIGSVPYASAHEDKAQHSHPDDLLSFDNVSLVQALHKAPLERVLHDQ